MEAAETPSYEDIRTQRVEANNRRMKELGLKDMSKSMTKNFVESKSASTVSKVKPHNIKRNTSIILRRSPRVAGTQPEYREADFEIPVHRRCSTIGLYKFRSRGLLPPKYCCDEARLATAEAAQEFEKTLNSGCPSFVKRMLHSHVTGGFWLGLPSAFCQGYLPNKDTIFMLEDEKGFEWETLYLAYKNGLSAGWRGFSIDHELEDGDALVFELVEACRFKVNIFKADGEVAQESKAALNSSTKDLSSTVEIQIETSHFNQKVVRRIQIHSRATKSVPSKKQKLNDEHRVMEKDSKESHKRSIPQANLPTSPKEETIEMAESKSQKEETSEMEESKSKVLSGAFDNRASSDKYKLESSSSIRLETGRLRPRRIIPHAGKIIDMLPRKKPHGQLLTTMVKAEKS